MIASGENRRALVLLGDGRRFEATVTINGELIHLTDVNERIGSSSDMRLQPRGDRVISASVLRELRWEAAA